MKATMDYVYPEKVFTTTRIREKAWRLGGYKHPNHLGSCGSKQVFNLSNISLHVCPLCLFKRKHDEYHLWQGSPTL